MKSVIAQSKTPKEPPIKSAGQPASPAPPAETPAPAPKKVKKPKPPRQPSPFQRDQRENEFRYPDDARLNGIWTGDLWLLSLTMVLPSGKGLEVRAESTAIHKAMTMLWEAYRDAVAPKTEGGAA